MSTKHSPAGRVQITASWLALEDIPELLEQLGELADPGSDAWLAWDDSIDEFVFLEQTAENVAYDNGASGLAATDVQEAIDEIATTLVYAGYCTGASGASVAIVVNEAATGWTVSQQATGRFRVTHGLALSNAKYLSVVPAVSLNAGGTDDRYCNVTNENTNYFEVSVTDNGTGAVNDNFYFHAVRLAP